MVIREKTDQYMEEPRRWLSETGFHRADRPHGGVLIRAEKER